MNEKGKSTLGKFEKILNLRNYAENSIKIYSHYVAEMIESFNKPALHITSKDVKFYIENYNYSSISKQNQVYSSIKLFAKYILNIKGLDKIILERPRKEKRLPRIIDKEHILSSLDNITNLKHKSIISIAYSVGLRVSEVINLKISDIDSNRMVITINQSKGRKDRIAPLTPKVLSLLRLYYSEFKPTKYLFNGQFTDQYSASSCNQLVKKHLGETYHFHLLRHSCFTNLTDQGVDIRVIQKLAGHSSSKTTEIYTHVSQNILKHLPLAV